MKGPEVKYRTGQTHGARSGEIGLLVCLLLVAITAPGLCAIDADLSRPDTAGSPTSVRVGIYLVDLHEISGADQAFLADLVIQAEWLDPRLAGRWPDLHGVALDDVWNPRLQLVNQRGVTASLPQRVEVDPSGRVRYRQRWWGRYSVPMDLRDFPLDRQSFYVQVVSLGYTRDEVDLVVNAESMRSGRAEKLSVTDWKIGPAVAQIADLEPVPGARVLAGASLNWEGERFIGYYAAQVILPLVLIVLMGWTAVWVDPSVVTTRVSVSMTTMLTLIAYRFAIGKSVPNLPYLTRFDYFMLASTILIFMTLMLVAAGAYLVGKGKLPAVHHIDRWSRATFPVLFIAVFVLVWWG
jgi:hypothetical protein